MHDINKSTQNKMTLSYLVIYLFIKITYNRKHSLLKSVNSYIYHTYRGEHNMKMKIRGEVHVQK